ncbi:MAG: Holliday junction branch migration protein RuvA [Pseudomonadota bacterium]
MIGKLTGLVDSISEDHIILDVGGVGYLVLCSSKTLNLLGKGIKTSLLIETYVREDNISLFGFHSAEEKSSFNILQTVSGIGTRMALAILSILTPEELGYAVAHADKDTFRKISGVGPKLADRILVELKGKTFSSNMITPQAPQDQSVANDAISALINLGMNRNEVINLVKNTMQEQPDISIDNLIRIALQKRVKS